MTDRSTTPASIDSHYAREDVGDAILRGLRAAGKNPDALSADDLSAVDHFHSRGKPATLELAELAGVTRQDRVIDVGGGIGGAARTLADGFGCHVTVLDLTAAFCRAGAMLTARTGLSDRIDFHHGSALEMPFEDARFDLAWTEHSSMNIEEKERLYAEIRRVLRPGGRLALHEIMAGPAAPIHFPVPWASDPSISFLRPPDAIRRLLRDAGMEEVAWIDKTALSLQWFQQRAAASATTAANSSSGAAAGPPPIGIHLILGEAFIPMFENVIRNLEEDRLRIVQAVFRRT